MLITASTKIGDIIKSNPEAIDVLIAANKHFVKLKNPILRKILAPRVTVTEAAKIGKCPVSVILESLSKIGFEIKEDDFTLIQDPITITTTTPQPAYDCQLDVRQILADGGDPFNLIMKSLSQIDTAQTLLLINTFEPLPLIRILRQKGHTTVVSRIDADLVYTYITKCAKKNEIVEETTSNKLNDTHFNEILTKYEHALVEIDVRQLEMPQPMIKILDSIDVLPAGKALYVHHKKVPVYLLPELKDRGFQHAIVHDGPEVKMIIFRETIL